MNAFVWTPYGKSWFDFYYKDDLANPGVLIKVKGKNYLIGDLNDAGGVCDCCSALSQDTIVESYSILLTLEQINDQPA